MCDMKIFQHEVIHLRIKRLEQGIHQHLENLQANELFNKKAGMRRLVLHKQTMT
jgi:hypothetical protein